MTATGQACPAVSRLLEPSTEGTYKVQMYPGEASSAISL